MSRELEAVDIASSPEVLRLAEEVARSGEGRLLTRGDDPVAVLRPLRGERGRQVSRSRRPRRLDRTDSLFRIIGMCSTAEPTAIATHKQEYLADAYLPERARPPER